MTPAGPVRVLLVDDQPAKLLSYHAVLGPLDLELVSANSAHEALGHLLRCEFAVVLIDVIMPNLDGFELAAMIREHPRCRRTAIIFVSGLALSDEDLLRGYGLGAVDYVPVPVVPEILRAKVGAFVDLYRTTRQLEQLNEDLEHRVAARTVELEEANHRKDEFLATLAHELRNPLAAIRLATQILGQPAISPSGVGTSVDVIRRQVDHLVRLIDDLLDVSRITRGLISLRRDPVDIATVIEHAIESSRPLVAERRHSLSVVLHDSLPMVDGDAARLAQVMGNILNNAAKFTEPGGVITIATELEPDRIAIRVTDNGIGIPPQLLPKVFDLFTQSEAPLDRPSAGLGIGLALVRRLVNLHGGDVRITSEGRGRGTTVTVRLPLAQVAVASPQAPPAPPRSTDTPETKTSLRILAVDDNQDALDALAMLLRLAGHVVETATDGVMALDVAPAFAADVVLLDLGMPRLNGYDTAARMRQAPWGRDVGIIAVTGFGRPQDRDRVRESGFDAHLVKPVDSHVVLRTIDEVVRQRRAARGEGDHGSRQHSSPVT